MNSTPPRNLDKRTDITIGDRTFVVEADDLETLCLLGRGAYGVVEKMRHKQSETIMAVKVYLFIFNSQHNRYNNNNSFLNLIVFINIILLSTENTSNNS